MLKRAIAVPFLALVAVACASVPPPATRSAQNPAHPEASEAATPPLSPTLMSEPEPAAPSQAASPDPHPGHEGHSQAEHATESAGSAQGPYVCPMHPDVTSNKPGTCPVCGMTLARKKPEGPKQ